MVDKIKGLDRLKKQLSDLAKLDFSDALEEGGEFLKRKAMANTPVVTGDLRRSYKLNFIRKNLVELVVRELYSSIVEFRKPYLRPAIDTNEAVISKTIAIGVQGIIDGAV